MTSRTALVTGASSGIGEATARKLQGLGFTTYGAARRTDRLNHLAADGIRPLAMDVADDASMQAGMDQIISGTGLIDVLVNAAGYGSYGALEEVAIDEGRRQFEVNVFGPVRLIQLALPHMRAQRAGTIVNITSMGGKIYTPLGGWYHGTKFALEALSDCLRLEVQPFGIDVVIIEPGGIATEWGGIAADLVEETSGNGPYAPQAKAIAKSLRSEANEGRNSPPSVVADAIGTAVTTARPKTRYAVGFGAKPLITARGLLSDRQFDALISRSVGLPRKQEQAERPAGE
ncbi:oxidoreductase [Arthrobacter luteolus]|uniref:oxidoreductase n=1 Tax=Arthrobacter luteolus TaxID=98672 RepID=UPI00082AC2E9|nr:oxidoreductase [Arthrobacter luteolus]